ncbi:uncharacterized protein LOC119437201 [Dermacentor silvarum]|uniref:uncharacterized protein LOC119437201 n=1 Tax=Dermacentor silvarum TaxID=543639 RepID=UPI002100BBF4|nr:uncharacterized protein LOC119437201 [Dermacentor silvarum]
MVKHCGAGHCTAFYKVIKDGRELWRAQVSVLWPHEMSVDALAPSKRESLLMAKARVCSTLQEPPHEAAGELCPSRASSNDVVTLPGTPGQVGTLVSPEPPADQLPGTQTQKTVRRTLTVPSQRLKLWTKKRKRHSATKTGTRERERKHIHHASGAAH